MPKLSVELKIFLDIWSVQTIWIRWSQLPKIIFNALK